MSKCNKVVYHGTSKESRRAYSSNPLKVSFDYYGPKFFTESKGHAHLYAGKSGEILSCHLEIKNPFYVTKKQGGYNYMAGSEGSLFDDYAVY